MTSQTLRIVPHLDSSHALIFPIMEYLLQESVPIKIGRSISDRNISITHMTFRSKVVSRRHAEIYLQGGKVSYCLFCGEKKNDVIIIAR